VEDPSISDVFAREENASDRSLPASHNVIKRVDRSQTVPVALPSYSTSISFGSHPGGGGSLQLTSASQESPLFRRSATSPLPLDLDTLRLVRQRLADANAAGEMETQQLAQTAEVVHDIAGMLTNAMAKKLTAERQASRAPSSS